MDLSYSPARHPTRPRKSRPAAHRAATHPRVSRREKPSVSGEFLVGLVPDWILQGYQHLCRQGRHSKPKAAIRKSGFEKIVGGAMRGLEAAGKKDIDTLQSQSVSTSSGRQPVQTRGVNTTTHRAPGSRRVEGTRVLFSRGSENEGGTSIGVVSVEQRKRLLVDNVMVSVMRWLDLNLPEPEEQDECEDGDGDSRHQKHSKSGGSAQKSSSSGEWGRRKRLQREDSPEGNGAGDGGGGRDGKDNKRPRRDSEGSEAESKRLACPFYQHDPTQCTRSRACRGPGFKTVHRLKEHLKRVHRVPQFLCARCCEDYSSEALLAKHLRSNERCELAESGPPKGMTEKQETELKLRLAARENGKTEEKTWIDIFRILFPDVPDDKLPSPYYERETSRNLDGYILYIRKRFPDIVRKELEDLVEQKFYMVEEAMKREAVDIIKNVCCRLAEVYQQEQERDRQQLAGGCAVSVVSSRESSLSPKPGSTSTNNAWPSSSYRRMGADTADGPSTLNRAAVSTIGTVPEQGFGPEILDMVSGHFQIEDLWPQDGFVGLGPNESSYEETWGFHSN